MITFSNPSFTILNHKNFNYFLFYRFFMTTATLMQSVIVGWQLYSITKSVVVLGLIGLTEVIPQVSVSLFAGHFIDLYNRQKIIFYTTMLLLFGTAILIFYSIYSQTCIQLFGIAPIFITIFLTGFVRGILMPAHTAFMAQLVPQNLLPNAAVFNSANWHIAAVIGPAIGGLIYGFMGIEVAYSIVFLFYLTSTILIFNIKVETVTAIIQNNNEGIFKRISEGVKFVFNNQVLLGALTLDMFAVLFGGAVAMLPVFASDVLKIGPQGLGLLRACPAIGAIIMSVILMFYPPVKHTGKLLFISVAGFGLCMIGFGLSTSFILSATLLLLSGLFDNVSVVIRGTIIQIFTPNEMRGRVAAVNSIFIGSSNELGAFESGIAARYMGLVNSVVFGGAMTLLVLAVAAKKAPMLLNLRIKNK